MVRVARSDSKLLVVDESAKLMEALSWAPSAKRMLQEWGDRFQAPVDLLPAGMVDVQDRDVLRGWLYCMTFRKP
jgi:hypothetical protein